MNPFFLDGERWGGMVLIHVTIKGIPEALYPLSPQSIPTYENMFSQNSSAIISQPIFPLLFREG